MSGTLFVVSTPIGHLEDISTRAAEVLRDCDACYAEDTRRTRTLLGHVSASPELLSLHEHNERSRIPEILERVSRGEAVALVSDAGTPTVSDPGRRLVDEALGGGVRVIPIPGPSAVMAALSVSGLPADRFLFAGFPPRKGSDREAWIERVGECPETVVCFEAPTRLARLLEDLSEQGLGDRAAVVCRELTKIHEEIRAGTISELATVYGGRSVKGEVTLVLAGTEDAPEPAPDPEAIAEAARHLAARGASRRDIAGGLEERFGLSRNDAYRLSLEFEERRRDD